MKKPTDIVINIWDDYKQKPDYDVNEDTYAIVEETRLTDAQRTSVLMELFPRFKAIAELIPGCDVTINTPVKRDGEQDCIIDCQHITLSGFGSAECEFLMKMLEEVQLYMAERYPDSNWKHYKFISES